MADINDLSQIVQSINSNNGILQNMASVCGVIKNLNLDSGVVDGAKEKGNLLKTFCNNALKPVLTGLQTAITESQNLTIVDVTSLESKMTQVEASIGNIITSVLNLKDSDSLKAEEGQESKLNQAISMMDNVKKSINSFKSGVIKLHGGIDDFSTTITSLKAITIGENDLSDIFGNVTTILGSLDIFNDEGKNGLKSFFIEDADQKSAIDAWDEAHDGKEVSEDELKTRPKKMTVTDANVAKLQNAIKAINSVAKNLFNKDDGSKGLYGALDTVKTAIANIDKVKNVGDLSFVSIKDILNPLDIFNDEGKNGLKSFFIEDADQKSAIDAWDEAHDGKEVSEDELKTRPKKMTVTDANVAKLQNAIKAINSVAKNLFNKDDGSKGLYGALDTVKTAITEIAKINNIDTNSLNSIFPTVKGVLDSLAPYGGDIESLKTTDVDGQQKTVAEANVKRLQDVSKIIKTYAAAISKDNGEKGLVADLRAINDSMSQVQKLAVDQINETNFTKIDNAIVAITDVLVALGQKYNKDSGKRLQKSLEGVLGYTTIDKDEKGKEIFDEKGKAKTTSHTGVFAVINTFSKSLQNLFKENGTFDMLTKTDFSNITEEKIKEVFDKVEIFISIVVNSLERQAVESDDKRLLAMYGEEYIQKIQNITSSVNSILQAVVDITDPKKNPLIGNPVKILLVKQKIKKTFAALVSVINIIISEMEALVNILKDKKMDDINKAYEDISKVFTTVNNILKAIIEMPMLMLKFIPAAIIVMTGLIVFGLFLGILWLELKLISLIKFDKISKDLVPLTNLFKDLTNLFKDIEQLAIHITIAALAFVPMIIAGLLILQGLGVLILVIKAMIWMISFLNPEQIQDARTRMADLNKLLWSIIFLSLTMVLLAIVIIPATVGSLVVITGLFIISFVFKGIIELINTMAESVNTEMIVNIVKIILVLGAICIVLLAFMGMAIILLTMQNTVTQLRFGPIALFIGSMIALAALLVGLGAALSSATPVIVPAAAIVGVVVAAMLAILLGFMGMAKVLEEIQNTKLDIKVIKETATNIFTASKDVCLMAIDVAKLISINDIKQAKKTIKKMRRLVKQVREIAETLNKVNEIKLDGNLIESNVKVIFQTAKQVVSSLGNEDGTGVSPETIKKNGLRFKLTLVAFNVIFDDLNKLVKILNNVQKIKLDGEVITNSVKVVFQTAKQVVFSLGNEDGTGISPETIEKNGLQFKLTLVAFNVIFDDLNKLVKILGDIQNVKLDGKIITDSINVVFRTANEIIEKIVNNENVSLDKLREDKKEFDKISNQYKAIFEDFTKLTNILAGVDLEKFKNQTNGGFVGIMADIATASKNLEEVDGEKINKTLTSYGDFLKKVDKTDLKKLETSAKMFEEMAKFSESINGNFDKMADTLNEKIGPLLEDLKNTLNDVHIQVTENGVQAQANTDRIVEKQEIREQMQASGQTQNLTVEEVDRRIDRKYQENVQQRYGIDEIASKLATLIDLFQSGEAVVKTT